MTIATSIIAAVAGLAISDAPAWDHSAVADRAGDMTATQVQTVDPSVNGVQLQCAPSGMAVWVAVEPLDFAGLADVRTNRTRVREAKLFVDGELADTRDWTYLPSIKAAYATGGVAAKIYNAVALGQSVSFELKKTDRVDVHLPEADEAFTTFASECQSLRAS